ncbi:hypothetical protein F2P79_006188 [Pimephales promelas]|nr:hypothetical protein F2P79_006188 [Pimephales promelas]
MLVCCCCIGRATSSDKDRRRACVTPPTSSYGHLASANARSKTEFGGETANIVRTQKQLLKKKLRNKQT